MHKVGVIDMPMAAKQQLQRPKCGGYQASWQSVRVSSARRHAPCRASSAEAQSSVDVPVR